MTPIQPAPEPAPEPGDLNEALSLLESFLMPRKASESFQGLAAFLAHRTGLKCAVSVHVPGGEPPVLTLFPSGRPADETQREALDQAARRGFLDPDAAGPYHEGGILVLPVSLRGRREGAIALPCGDGEHSSELTTRALLYFRIYSWKMERDQALEDAGGRERQLERWFRTADAQIRLLDRERQKFHALVNRSDASVMVLGADCKVRWVNPEMARTHSSGADPLALVGRECREVCGNQHPCEDCPAASVLRGEPIAHMERKRELGGSWRDLYVTALPIRGPEGEVEEVLVSMQDLSDLGVLRRSESRMRQLFEFSADAILMVDPGSLSVIMANATAHRMLGKGPGGLAPGNLREMVPPEEESRISDYMHALFEGQHPGGLDVSMLQGDGSRLECNLCGTSFDLDGAEVFMLELRDVSELRRMAIELGRSEHLASLGTMSAGIAHEFKNRLAPLRGLAQLLAGSAGEPGRVHKYTDLMLQEVDRLTALVRDTLDFARPREAQPSLLDVASLLLTLTREFRLEFSTELAEREIQVQFSTDPPGPISAMLDHEQMRQVFHNVFKNALEACGAGATIRVDVRQASGQVLVLVADSGAGMEPAVLRRILEPFFTTKGTRGTGLGMSVVRSLVESNGGSLEVRSQPGVGTEVEIRLRPALALADEEAA